MKNMTLAHSNLFSVIYIVYTSICFESEHCNHHYWLIVIFVMNWS